MVKLHNVQQMHACLPHSFRINRILSKITYTQLSIIAPVVPHCYSRVNVPHKVAKISRDWRLTGMYKFVRILVSNRIIEFKIIYQIRLQNINYLEF